MGLPKPLSAAWSSAGQTRLTVRGQASAAELATPPRFMGQVSVGDFQTLLPTSALASAAEALIAASVPIAASAVGSVIRLVAGLGARSGLPPAAAGARGTSLAAITS